MNIKRIRKKNKMTQQELADYMQVTVRTINYWEAGDYEPKGPALIMLRQLEKKK